LGCCKSHSLSFPFFGVFERGEADVVLGLKGNVGRKVTRDLMAKLPETQNNKRGLVVDDFMHLKGADGIYAMWVDIF
jgi:NADH dehydrogenase FAD-containing subunit